MDKIEIIIADDKTCAVALVNEYGNSFRRVNGLTPEQATHVKELVEYFVRDARSDERQKIRDSI